MKKWKATVIVLFVMLVLSIGLNVIYYKQAKTGTLVESIIGAEELSDNDIEVLAYAIIARQILADEDASESFEHICGKYGLSDIDNIKVSAKASSIMTLYTYGDNTG